MRLQDEPDLPAQINIVPMIDVIFAILTFFIMSTLYLTRSEGLPVNLPKAGTAQSGQPAKVTVTIDLQGKLWLNRQPVQLENLAGAVGQQIKPGEDLLVVLNADKGVYHGRVIEVMDRVRQVKGAKLAIATQKQ
ncbi:biopolymer transporter ExbD [Kamptonema sp. UHCC 0994]|uniref:ExbD/TolR family protein n=1 Tax=Kamptonema sp. UHCC 0994 TaxID=3031329 RepID=UPI0023BAD943|nr:biopolymer transporter ExbD [Kamptonema sp. UHCC 0994]MDF0556070.1 biopolymer transporter ExbD [Kamptonema sp. UHCC 0994]